MSQEETLKPEWQPEPAESFAIEFLNSESQRHIRGLSEMGFRYSGSRLDGEDIVITGERGNEDGTTIEVRIKKGEKYKSPKELADMEKGE